MDGSLTKVHVDLPNHWATSGESLWARALGEDRFAIENVPFYAYDLNYGDIVEARAAAPGFKPSVLRVVDRSGHRTTRVFFLNGVAEGERLRYVHSLDELHVTFERCGGSYFALDLEPDANIEAVRDQLDEGVREGLLEYETSEARAPGSFDAAPSENSDGGDSMKFTLRLTNRSDRTQTVVLEPWTGEYRLSREVPLDILVEGEPTAPLEIEIDVDCITVTAFDSAGAMLTAYRNGRELRSEHISPSD